MYKQIRLDRIADAPDESVIPCLSVVTIDDVPVPGDDELLLRVILTAVHPCDLLCCAGVVSRRRDGNTSMNHKYLPGMEAVATVVMAGKFLTDEFPKGTRVCVKAWSPWGRWEEADGVWSEYLVVHKKKVIPIPTSISDPNAALFLSISVTAYVMLVDQLRLRSGDWVLQGASGSALGRWAIELAAKRGINTINLVRREEQVDELLDQTSATHVFWCPEGGERADELVDSVWELTGGKGLNGALDPIADGIVASIALRAMARYGTVLKYGGLGQSPMTLSAKAILRTSQESLRIKGFSVQNWWMPDTPDNKKAEIFADVIREIEQHSELTLQMSSVFSFEQYDQAIRSSLRHKTAKVFMMPSIAGGATLG